MEQVDDFREYVQLIKNVFSTPEGAKLLRELSQKYQQRISFKEGGDALTMAFCEGQRDVVLMLTQLNEININDIPLDTTGELNV